MKLLLVRRSGWTCVHARVATIASSIIYACLLLALPARSAAESVQLRWDPPPNGTALAYVVERGTAPGVYPVSAVVARGTTTYLATGLERGVRYYFVVRAVDGKGLRSGPSNEISVLLPKAASPPASTSPPPPPPAPVATTVTVKSESALQQAARALVSRRTLLVAPGVYKLSRPLEIAGSLQDVTIRSSTGRAADVVLVGPPATSATPQPASVVARGATRLTLAHLTIQSTPGYAVVLGEGVQQPRLTGLRIVDNGQFVQVARHASGAGAAGGVIEGCTFEYTGQGVWLPSGIDIRGGRDWVIRGNRFTDAAPTTRVTFGPTVHAWQGSVRTVVERNTFVNATREIVFGLGDATPDQHTGGVIRNNMIVRRPNTGSRGPAISLLDAPSAVVVHNSVLVSGTSPTAIEYAHADTRNVIIANNLLDRGVEGRDLAHATLAHNVTTATPWWFVGAAKGDLRLQPLLMRLDGSSPVAPLVIDAAWAVATTTHDHEGQARPMAAAADIGADEHAVP